MTNAPRAVLDWWRWESSRRLTPTPVIRFITVERFVKATVLVLGGLALIAFQSRSSIPDLADRLQTEYNLDSGRHLWLRLVTVVLERFGRHPDAIGLGAILYGLLEAVEGVGLLLRRRWAEYLVLVATGAFLPLEIDEIIRKLSVFKVLALLVNIAIMVYLVLRKRLFLERPSDRGPEPA